ncbi:hypothetical protein TBLA_0B03030 [Henningerozyma blattae CBS 6284]|uniref:PQ loop repeat protein n=1 Tax=Henningerozyma blattae (strain ATCC 34711 / CBS 6284 / DSM 70876 / NBRC 10599 / NRRL Y-10934 / UCD 77-7) TaxID=1071380 RepID=I2GYE3_HENB6|nr:hypothetical protein TBLA_0B03030 [Tetrapisispora blattae CBS 6284]CCH59145.1 hypothetical protein TBLA_0B03030 [Tetrapisispora blattae CBS 6284]
MISESASTALGTVATVCWCVQLIPQIYYNWKRKDCTGLPPIMMFLWVVSGVPFGIYFCISRATLILQIQPHLFMFFCCISFIQTCYYPPAKLPKWKIALIIACLVIFTVSTEISCVLALRPLYDKGIKWPDLIFGIIATILLAVGLLPPYFELAKRKGEVVGINFLFLFVDSLGAWLSMISVIVGNMDIMGIILYCIVAAFELGIFTSHFIWCCRFKWFSKEKNSDTENNQLDLQKEETINWENEENADDVEKITELIDFTKETETICDEDTILENQIYSDKNDSAVVSYQKAETMKSLEIKNKREIK